MQQILATLDGPAAYYGFAVRYVPEALPGSFIPDEVSIYPIYRPREGEEVPHHRVTVHPMRPYDPPHYAALDPENTRRALPILEGTTMRLVYDAPGPIPGLTAWFLQPEA